LVEKGAVLGEKDAKKRLKNAFLYRFLIKKQCFWGKKTET
jgi:hypothetical protein